MLGRSRIHTRARGSGAGAGSTTTTDLQRILALSPSLLLWRAQNAGTVNRDGTGATATGTDLVGRIIDLSGNNNHASAPADSNRAQLNSTGWVFSGVDDYYSLLNAISITENMTVVRAFKRASAGINSTGLASLGAGGIPHESQWESADNVIYQQLVSAYSAPHATSAASTLTGSFVLTSQRTTSTSTMRRNGSVIATGTGGTVGGTLAALGNTNGRYNSGEISFLALFPSELTGADLTLVEQIAASTNGATLS